MFDLESLKVVLGSSVNQAPVEDAVTGSNGTAVLMRINNLIDALENALNDLSPDTKGSIVTMNSSGSLDKIRLGASTFCLVSEPSTPTGTAWRERVTLDTEQTITAEKVFTAGIVCSALEVGGHSALNTVNANAITTTALTTGTAQVSGALNVAGQGTFSSSVSIAGSLNAGDTTTASISTGPITASGNASLMGTLSVAGNAVLNSNLTVGGSAVFESLTINDSLTVEALYSGPIQGTTITGTSLSLTGNASISGQLTVNGSASLGATSVTSLTSSGPGVFTNLTAAAITALSLTASGVVEGATLKSLGAITGSALTITGLAKSGSLETGNITSSALSTGPISGSSLVLSGAASMADLMAEAITSSSVQTNDISGTNLLLSGTAAIGQSLRVSQNATIYGEVDIDGHARFGANISAQGNITGNSLSVTTDITSNALTTGSARVTGDIEVSGDSRLGNVSGGTATFVGLEVQDDLDVLGTLTVNELIVNDLTIPSLSGTNTGDEVPATSSTAGLVTLSSDGPPIVYRQAESDLLFLRKDTVGQSVCPLTDGKVPPQYLPLMEGGEPIEWVPTDGDYRADQIAVIPPLLDNDRVQGVLSALHTLHTAHTSSINPHNVNASQVGAIPTAEKGALNGVAALSNGKLALENIPEEVLLLSAYKYEMDFTASNLSPASVLTVDHNLDSEYPEVTVWSNGKKIIIPDEVTSISASRVIISLASYNSPSPITGTWHVGVRK